MDVTADLAGVRYCYVTTRGRSSGRPHTVEIWFAASERRPGTLYLLSGGGDRSDWVRNLLADPAVRVRIGDRELHASARRVDDPDEAAEARGLVFGKYDGTYGGDLSEWRDRALPIALDLR